MSASSQYYAFLPSIKETISRLAKRICRKFNESCETILSRVETASYLDIDYDTITRALVINVGWSSTPSENGWTESISRGKKDGTIEIGVLTHEANSDPEDIGFGGFLTVLGQDESPSQSAPS